MTTKQLRQAALALYASFTQSAKADGADCLAIVKTLKTVALNDADTVKSLSDELFTAFGEAHKDAAQIRVNILRNARRVAYGGTKDSKAVRGKGMPAMLEICASVSSIRELKKALADAVPEALKGASGGDRKSKGKGKGKGTKSNPLSVPKVATREEAFAAARKILEFVRDKFTKPSEIELAKSINATCELLSK